MRRIAAILMALAGALLAAPALADPGVTISLGRITLDTPLRAGGSYPLPPLPVTNSGTDAGTYQVRIVSMEGQPELKPEPAWVVIRPQSFPLQPKERREVGLTLDLPWLLPPGSYHCLIQVGPSVEAQGAGLGVAAAARLAFTVEHGNILTATVYNVREALEQRAPWSYLILTAFAGVGGYPLLGRFFGIRISIQREK